MTDPSSKPDGQASSTLEKDFATVVELFRDFIHDQKTSSALLLACTLIALIIANSPLARMVQ